MKEPLLAHCTTVNRVAIMMFGNELPFAHLRTGRQDGVAEAAHVVGRRIRLWIRSDSRRVHGQVGIDEC